MFCETAVSFLYFFLFSLCRLDRSRSNRNRLDLPGGDDDGGIDDRIADYSLSDAVTLKVSEGTNNFVMIYGRVKAKLTVRHNNFLSIRTIGLMRGESRRSCFD